MVWHEHPWLPSPLPLPKMCINPNSGKIGDDVGYAKHGGNTQTLLSASVPVPIACPIVMATSAAMARSRASKCDADLPKPVLLDTNVSSLRVQAGTIASREL